MKECNVCKEVLSLDNFYRNGDYPYCIPCTKIKNKEYHLKNRDKILQKKKEYQQDNKEKRAVYAKKYYQEHKEEHRIFKRQWARDNPEKIKGYGLKANYGISLEDYNSMLKEQEYKCMICNIHENDLSKPLSVDHCHTTGIVRGLLCTNCNTSLGGFMDNIEYLEAGIEYLRRWL